MGHGTDTADPVGGTDPRDGEDTAHGIDFQDTPYDMDCNNGTDPRDGIGELVILLI